MITSKRKISIIQTVVSSSSTDIIDAITEDFAKKLKKPRVDVSVEGKVAKC